MNHDDEPDAGLPVACTLTAGELARRRDALVTEVASVIAAEHHCCRFLRFALIVQPGEQPMILEATGPEGTEEFLSTLMNANPSAGR